MESPNNALVNTTVATDNEYTIYNPRLQLEYCILDSDIMSEMLSLTGGIFKIPSSSYAGSQRTLDATSSQVVSLPFRYSSCKNLICAMRGAGYDQTDSNTIVSRSVNKTQTYWFRQGAYNYPSSQVSVLDGAYAGQNFHQAGEAIAEVLKSLHAVNSVDAEVSFDISLFLQEGSTSNAGSFILATELEGKQNLRSILV